MGLVNLAAGGISGAISKTLTAPLEKVKLAIQTQDSNPKILSGEMKRFDGMGDCFKRHITEIGTTSLWRGNVANCIRYVPTAACNLMFKDTVKRLFPKYNKNTQFTNFAMVQVASGSVAGGITNTLVYPLIYVRTALGADIGTVRKYNGVADCLKKTVAENGVSSLQWYWSIHHWYCCLQRYPIRSSRFHQGFQPISKRSFCHWYLLQIHRCLDCRICLWYRCLSS